MSFYDDASLIMYPSGYKEDKIYSLKPTDGSGDLDFTRASTATRVNAEGLIETSPVNLLKSTSDLSTQSTYWTTNQSGTSIQNAAIAPDGTTTASQITSTGGQFSGIAQNGISVSAVPYTYSCYLKATSGTPTIRLTLFDGVTFHQTNLTITSEWVRYSFTFTPIAGTFGVVISCSSVNTWLAWGAQVNSGSTAKPYFPTTDRLNVPRIDYTGGVCGKLLLEPQRTNLVTYSEDFSNAAWAVGGVTIAANDTTSPDGTTNADKFLETAVNGIHVINNTSSITASATSTASVFYKKGTRQYFSVKLQIGSSSYTQVFDADGLTTGSNSSNGLTNVSTKIEDYGNGWVRASVAGTSASGTSTYLIIGLSNSLNPTFHPINFNPTYQGSVTDYGYFYGAQLEAGTYPTSYIPTLASSVTRLADLASKTGISSLINSTEGVLYFESNFSGLFIGNSAIGSRISLSDGTLSNRISLNYKGSNGAFVVISSTGGVTAAYEVLGYNDNQNYKIALVYSATEFSLWVDGVQVIDEAFDASKPALTLNTIDYADGSGNNNYYGKNQALIIFPTVLTNTQLATLTTI